MSSKKKDREQLINDISTEGRKMSTITVIFHQAVAEKAGMTGADHKYLDLLFHEGAMPAGKLAELTGLTTGAVTGIIDRLEKQGLALRKNDPNDRRKVVVVPQVEEAMKKIGPVFDSLQEDFTGLYDQFSEEELKIVRKYLLSCNEFLQNKTRYLRKSKL